MRVISLVSLSLFATGALLLHQGLLREGGQVYLVFVFPVIVISGPLSLLGTLLIFLSLFLAFLSLASFIPSRLFPGLEGAQEPSIPEEPPFRKERRKEWGGFLLLGPIPVVFGSNVKITTAMLILAIVLTVTLVILFL